MINRTVQYFVQKPSVLFLADSIGAFTTSFLLFVVLRNLEDYFAMPASTLTFLSIIAAVFFIYSGICFIFLKRNWINYIRIIMIANMLYCLLTLAILVIDFSSLTYMDIIYFVGEVMIISLLVFIEYKTAQAI